MFLIVANSGRMLAEAAKKANFIPLVIDVFADLDTQEYATAYRQVKSLSLADLVPAVGFFIERYAVTKVIYGSGFECYPESLFYLNSRLEIQGNTAEVFACLLDKPVFFSVLDGLNIPYPEVVFNPPDYAADWLVKPMQGQGGVGISYYQATDSIKESFYWQKFQAGVPHSVLFLADGKDVQVIGFNRQWSVHLNDTLAFIFSGVINNAELPAGDKQKIMVWLKQLVFVFGLNGLNSLDFIFTTDCCYVLEINPRPSASMQLYDDNLLVRHVDLLLFEPILLNSYTGYQIVYADSDITIPEQFIWPDWCSDLPKAGNICHTGQPICSIIAHQNESQSVAKQLLTRQQLIINKLQRF